MERQPKVSILTSVYNGEEFLEEMMDSVVNQTFSDWEMIVIDDCSTDKTGKILSEYRAVDKRICFYKNEKNLGLAASLNKALELARGTYVVRMDADDICRRDRLEKQVAFMEENPEISISCCKYFILDGDMAIPTFLSRREEPETIKAMLLFSCPILHPGVIGKWLDMKSAGYRKECTCTEDLDLWLRLAQQGKKIAIQNEFLLLYRIHGNQITAKTKKKQQEEYAKIIAPFYKRLLFELNPEQVHFLTFGVYSHIKTEINGLRFLKLCRVIKDSNKKTQSFTAEGLRYAIFEVLLHYKRAGLPFWVWLPELFFLRPDFLVREYIERKKRIRKNRDVSRGAAEIFGFTEIENTSKDLIFRKRNVL